VTNNINRNHIKRLSLHVSDSSDLGNLKVACGNKQASDLSFSAKKTFATRKTVVKYIFFLKEMSIFFLSALISHWSRNDLRVYSSLENIQRLKTKRYIKDIECAIMESESVVFATNSLPSTRTL